MSATFTVDTADVLAVTEPAERHGMTAWAELAYIIYPEGTDTGAPGELVLTTFTTSYTDDSIHATHRYYGSDIARAWAAFRRASGRKDRTPGGGPWA